jgi:DNA-binding transcriptional MerR regulator
MQTTNTDSSKRFTARDVKSLAGLTNRQLHFWGSRGVFPDSRADVEEWRTFSTDEMFSIMICATLKERFGLPLDALGRLCAFLTDQGLFVRERDSAQSKAGAFWLVMDAKANCSLRRTDQLAKTLVETKEHREGRAFVLIDIEPVCARLTQYVENNPRTPATDEPAAKKSVPSPTGRKP